MIMSNAHMMANDIDWFCIIDNQYPLHLASNGSIIPEFAADGEELAQMQQMVANLPTISDNVLRNNTRHIDELSVLEGFEVNRYLESFRYFANKGFYSFDFEWNNDVDGQYKLLISPGTPLKVEQFRMIPHISINDLDDRYRDMFIDIVQQIRNLE